MSHEGQHRAHCFQGENPGCKYGDDDCPVAGTQTTETPQQEAERLLVTYVQSASLEPLGEYVYASSARDLLDWQITARREAKAALAEERQNWQTSAEYLALEQAKDEMYSKEIAHLRRLEAAVDRMRRLFPLKDEDPNETFERIAQDFYDATGMLRPGKDQAAAAGGYPTLEERIERFGKWRDEAIAAYDASKERP